MNEHEALHQILTTVICSEIEGGTDHLIAYAEEAAKAFSAGLAAFNVSMKSIQQSSASTMSVGTQDKPRHL